MDNFKTILNICMQKGFKITPLRFAIIEIISYEEKCIKPYLLFKKLKKKKQTTSIMSIYRTINFLEKNNVLHKIKTLKSYFLCCNPNRICQLFICVNCKSTIEKHEHSVYHLLQDIAYEERFFILKKEIEITGLCKACKNQ